MSSRVGLNAVNGMAYLHEDPDDPLEPGELQDALRFIQAYNEKHGLLGDDDISIARLLASE